MSIGPPIPEIQHFQSLTLKIQGQGHKEGIPPYRFISFSFHVNRPSHSWDTAISKFDIENSRSRSWVRSKFKVTTWVQHSVNSHPKAFIPCQSGIQFLSYDFSKIWPWKSRVKVMGEVKVESHNMGPTFNRLTSLSFHVDQASHSWVPTFSKFDLENKGSKVMGEVTVQSHNVGLTSYRLIPFILCQTGIPFLSYDFFENLTLKIKGQGHGWGHSSKSQCGSNILSIHIPFVPCQSALPFLRYSIFKIWPWKWRVKVKWPWCCTTTGLDNSIELRMVQIHPGVSEIWVPQSEAQVLPHLTSFWPVGKPIWGKWANDYDSAQLQVQTSPWNFKWGQSIQRFQRYAFRKVWTQFVPNLTSFWPMGKPIWGKWANDHDSAQL